MRMRALRPLLGSALFVAVAVLAPVLATDRPWIADSQGNAVVSAPIPFAPELEAHCRPNSRPIQEMAEQMVRQV